MTGTDGQRPAPSYESMRRLVQTSPLAHACAALRASQVAAADWDIRAAGRPDWRRRAILAFDHPNQPDGYLRFPAWASRIVTEIMTTDTLCLHVRHGPAYQAMYSESSQVPLMELLDGARILPRPAPLGLSGLPGLDGTEGEAAILAAAGFESVVPGGVREITDMDGRTLGGRLREFLKAIFDQVLAGWPGTPAMEFEWKPEPEWDAFAADALNLAVMALMALPAGWEIWPRE